MNLFGCGCCLFLGWTGVWVVGFFSCLVVVKRFWF